MMIKGVQKNVMVIRDPKSKLYEQAIFILKPHGRPYSRATLLDEAKKILDAQTAEPSRKRR